MQTVAPAILLITYLSGPFEGGQAYVAYPSLADCDKATSAVSDTLAWDHKIECLGGMVSPRPERNPWYEVGE